MTQRSKPPFRADHVGSFLRPLELLEKIDMEVGASKFAVGDALQTKIFLHADNVPDCGVLDFAQLAAIDLTCAGALASIEQFDGAQEAADVIGAKGWFRALSHELFS